MSDWWAEAALLPPELTRWEETLHPRDRRGKFVHSRMAQGLVLTARQASPEQFDRAFSAAFRDSPYRAFVNHYSAADIRKGKMTPILAAGGKAGLLIHDHGDGRIEPTALFNRSGNKGMGLALLKMAVAEHGANYVECYGPVLNKMYASLGFADSEVYPFDKNLAAPDWDYARFDNPDYHMMRIGKRARRAKTPSDEDNPGFDTAALAEEARQEDPQWWERFGREAMSAAQVVIGIADPAKASHRYRPGGGR